MRHDYLSLHSSRIDNAIVTLSICLAVAMVAVPPVVTRDAGARTHNPIAPWTLVRANNKHLARFNIIKDRLGRLHYTGKNKRLIRPDSQIVFEYDVSNPESTQLAK